MPPHLCFLSLNALPYLLAHSDGFVGGAENQEVRIARGLAARGWKITFLTLDHGQGAVARAGEIAVRALFRPRAGVPLLRFLAPRLTSVRQALRATPADLYLTRTASIWSAVIARHARAVGAASILALSHDREAALELRGVLNARDRWLFRRGLHQVDQVIAQTDSQARILRERTGLEALVIPNGIDPGPRPEWRWRSGARRAPLRVLWVGTLRPWKRPEIFVDLAAALPRVEFAMVGGADPAHPGVAEWVRARAEALPNLRFWGSVAPARMPGYYARADLLVSTSRAEGFANTFLEAWAQGIGVVSLGPDPQGAISRGGGGILVDSPAELRRAVETVAARPEWGLELGKRGRELVEQEFSATALVDRYERLCRRLIGLPRSKRRVVSGSVAFQES